MLCGWGGDGGMRWHRSHDVWVWVWVWVLQDSWTSTDAQNLARNRCCATATPSPSPQHLARNSYCTE
jgi:hypothetical protein